MNSNREERSKGSRSPAYNLKRGRFVSHSIALQNLQGIEKEERKVICDRSYSWSTNICSKGS
jgi:hypothetical protein